MTPQFWIQKSAQKNRKIDRTLLCRHPLIWAFFAMGPLGNILVPWFFPEHFRAYYIFLPLFPFFYTIFNRHQLHLVLLFIPFFLYALISVIPVEIYGKSSVPFPLFRYFLLLTQFLFVVGAAGHLKEEENVQSFFTLYLKAFFISLLVGYVLFIGYYANAFSLDFIRRFCTLTQFGYQFLRFSPGSYPNEYGIVSSFVLSILTLLFFRKETLFSKRFHRLFFVLTFIALLLTTTRAAYLAYFFSLFYIAYLSGYLFRLLKWVLPTSIAVFSLLNFFGIDMVQIFKVGFSSETLLTGSMHDRTSYWSEAWAEFLRRPLFGEGFACGADLHNVYLQFLVELGILGTSLLLGTLLAVTLSHTTLSLTLKKEKSLMECVQTLGLFHVASFAASNHNLNHHLTWLIFLLYIRTLIQISSTKNCSNGIR